MVTGQGSSGSSLKKVLDGRESIMKLHQQALSTKEMQQILKEKGKWDLVVASPFLNEVGVMLGKLGFVWVGQMPYFFKIPVEVQG